MARRGNGEGTISQRADGRWEGKYVDAAGVRKSIYGRYRGDVADRLRAAVAAREEGLPSIGARQKVSAFLESWLESAEPGLRSSTFKRYAEYVRIHAVPEIGRIALAKLGPADLERMYGSRLRKGSSPSTVLHLHRVMHRALEQAMRWGSVVRNVAKIATPPRVAHREMKALDPEEARSLLDAAAGDRLEALYVLALTTGMRQGELLGLQWRDVDLELSSIRVQRSLQRARSAGGPRKAGRHGRDLGTRDSAFELVEPKTSRSRRQVTLGQAAVSALRRWRLRQAEERLAIRAYWVNTGLVFTNELGENAEAVMRTSWRNLLKRAGISPVRFHDLRHSAASLLLAQGVHPKIVSEMLGHSTIAITLDLYSHVTPTMQREAAARMDELLAAR